MIIKMLKAKSMMKMTLVGPKTLMNKVISKLYTLRIVHIIDHVRDNALDIGKPSENSDELSDLIVRIRSLISTLGVREEITQQAVIPYRMKKLKLSLSNIKRDIDKLHEQVMKGASRKKEIESSLRRIASQQRKLEILKVLGDFTLVKDYESLSSFIGSIGKAKGLEQGISSVTNQYHLVASRLYKAQLIALFVPKSKASGISSILEEREFIPIDFAEIKEIKHNDMTIKQVYTKLHKKALLLEEENRGIDEMFRKTAKKWGTELVLNERILSEESEKAMSPLKFAATEESFIITGWVPETRLDRAVSILEKTTDKRIYVKTGKATGKDAVPVELENPRLVKPFEFFLDLYTLPKYKEIDPTLFIFFGFPFFFGFMLGDMGYGLTTLIIFLLLKRQFPKIKRFFNILIMASIATIFFGMLFGEIFGEEVIFGYALPHIISRAHQIHELLYMAVAIGVFHINLGLILGFVNELKSHGFAKAVFEKLSWIILEAAVVIGVLVSVPAGVVIGIISVIMLYIGEGVKGLIELPSIFSNILSYARLMAIGLASVQLAMVINTFAKDFFHQGGFMILAAIAILLIGHSINILLGLLGPFLHSLRLQYVEFFSKFFQGGGKPYNPFGYKE